MTGLNNGNGRAGLLLNREEFEARLQQQVLNATSMRAEFLRRYMPIDGPNRNLNVDCGYPEGSVIDPWYFRDLYDREPVATRVVDLMPKECWQVQPEVYEDEDVESDTPFEEAWDNLSKELRGDSSWFQDAEGSPVWEYLYRADKLSGIGQFGVILFGLDDGRALYEPVEGVVSDKPTTRNAHMAAMPRVDESEVKLAEQMGSRLTVNLAANPSGGGMIMKDGQPTPIASLSSQYLGVQYMPPEYPTGKPRTKETKLVFLRPFDQSSVQVTQWEANIMSPRFGQPIMYRVTLNDYRDQHTGIGIPMATVQVHWTRILHVADNLNSSEVIGVPRIRPVLNPVLDIRKVRGAAAEGFWKGGFPGISLETHPQLGGDVAVDEPSIKSMLENYQNTYQRYILAIGMSAKMLSPAIADPTPHINVLIEAVCVQLGCPVRVFRGSERGELASSQDDSSWNDRIRHRQNSYVTPRVIVPFVDRLIILGVLPTPAKKRAKPTQNPATTNTFPPGTARTDDGKEDPKKTATVTDTKGGYSVRWPDLDSLGDKDKAMIALQETQAVTAFVSGGGENFMAPKDFWVDIMGRDEEKAEALVQGAEDHVEQSIADHGDLAEKGDEHDLQPTPPPGFEPKPPPPPALPGMPGGPPTPPVKMGAGESLVHPQTGKTVAKTPFPPQPKGAVAQLHAKKPTKNTALPIGKIKEVGDWLSRNGLMPGYGQIFSKENGSGEVWYVGGDGDERGFGELVKEKLLEVPGWDEVTYEAEAFPPRDGTWVQVYPKHQVHNEEQWPVVFNQEEVANAFCPTGEGGGVDPSCSPKGGGNKFPDVDTDKMAADGKARMEKMHEEVYGKLTSPKAEANPISPTSRGASKSLVKLLTGNAEVTENCGGEGGTMGPCPHLDTLKAISDEFAKGSGGREEVMARVDQVLAGLSKEQLKEAAAKFGSRSAKGRKERVEGIKRFISDRREMLQRATRNEGVENSFCSTGEGGGVDPSCSPGEGVVRREFTGSDKQKSWAREIKERAMVELNTFLKRLGDRGGKDKELMLLGRSVMESAVDSTTWIDYARQHKGEKLAQMIGEVVSRSPKAQFVPPGIRAFVNKNPVRNIEEGAGHGDAEAGRDVAAEGAQGDVEGAEG